MPDVGRTLPIVYAYEDRGPVLTQPTRWNPRRVRCTSLADHSDAPGKHYVVKFRRGRPGAAALISEVICWRLMKAMGLRTLDPALVALNPQLAGEYHGMGLIDEPTDDGTHFGTEWAPESESGPLAESQQLADAGELIRMWAADSWVMNLDRENEGNYRLVEPDAQGRFHLVAVDHSDCFLGSSSMLEPGFTDRSCRQGCVAYPRLLEPILAEDQGRLLGEAANAIRNCAESVLEEAAGLVPGEWWAQAGLRPRILEDALRERAARIEEILQVEHWRGVARATGQGRLLDV
jgi:hypothetical protein